MPDEKKPDDKTSKPGEPAPPVHSINEPGPDDPKPFKVTDEDAYPEGIDARNAKECPPEQKPAEPAKPAAKPKAKAEGYDPDELEDEIDEAEDEGDITSSKPHGKKKGR